jgi:hypothetical protein
MLGEVELEDKQFDSLKDETAKRLAHIGIGFGVACYTSCWIHCFANFRARFRSRKKSFAFGA